MSDLIDRQAAIDALDCINGVEEVLRSLPSAQPERKRGRWSKPIHSEYKYQCDQCGAWHRARYDFCPSCGADMRERDDN